MRSAQLELKWEKGVRKKEKGIQCREQHRSKTLRCINDLFVLRLGIVWYIGRIAWKKPGISG